MNEIVNAINGVIWSPALIYLCLGVGLYFSLRTRFCNCVISKRWCA